MVAGLQKTAENLGLPFSTRTMTYNTRLAQELGLWAEDQGRGEIFHLNAFHAYFADGINLAKVPELLNLAEKSGLSRDKAQEVLLSRSYSERVDLDWADSRFKQINAVPTFVMGRHKLTGAQSYETLEELVKLYDTPLKKDL